jgi:hypothetical protein
VSTVRVRFGLETVAFCLIGALLTSLVVYGFVSGYARGAG